MDGRCGQGAPPRSSPTRTTRGVYDAERPGAWLGPAAFLRQLLETLLVGTGQTISANASTARSFAT
jgi:hypothetical protein